MLADYLTKRLNKKVLCFKPTSSICCGMSIRDIYEYIYKYIYIYINIEELVGFLSRRVHSKFLLGLFNFVYLFLSFLPAPGTKAGKIDFFIEVQIITGFHGISGKHSKYVEILILMEQHSNCRLSSAEHMSAVAK